MSKNMLHSFETKRLELKATSIGDRGLYYQLYTDPLLMQKICKPLTREEVNELFENVMLFQDKQGNKRLSWTIKDRLDGKSLGIVVLTWNCQNETTSSIGIILLREAHGKRIAHEACGAATEYAFNILKLKQINAQIDETNIAVEHIAKNFGCVDELDSSVDIPFDIHPNLKSMSIRHHQWQYKLIEKIW